MRNILSAIMDAMVKFFGPEDDELVFITEDGRRVSVDECTLTLYLGEHTYALPYDGEFEDLVPLTLAANRIKQAGWQPGQPLPNLGEAISTEEEATTNILRLPS